MPVTHADFIAIKMVKKFYPIGLAYGSLVHGIL